MIGKPDRTTVARSHEQIGTMMGLSNYPPGVNGREPEINGYEQRVVPDERRCDNCEVVAIVEVTQELVERWATEIIGNESWKCAACGWTHERYDVTLDEIDPDAGRD